MVVTVTISNTDFIRVLQKYKDFLATTFFGSVEQITVERSQLTQKPEQNRVTAVG